jgi:uncharacterized membrane protein YidH (DUF202 family)
MLDTPVAVLAALALLMPGFVIAELALAGSARGPRGDLEIALRSLAYTLVIHLVFAWWTAMLVRHIGPEHNWVHHVWAIVLYVAVVLVIVPVIAGTALNRYLAGVEHRHRQPGAWAAALGAGASRDAFDFAFQHTPDEGVWLIVELIGHTPETPQVVGGRYGAHSAVGQTPSQHDIYLEALCTTAKNPDGIWTLGQIIEPERGLYVPASQVSHIEVLQPGAPRGAKMEDHD